MFDAPTTIVNYFNVIRVDESTLTSDPPYIGGVSMPGRLYGGLAVSQVVNVLIALKPGINPHTVNYKFVAPEWQTDWNRAYQVLIARLSTRLLVLCLSSRVRSTRYPGIGSYSNTNKFVCLKELSYAPLEPRSVETPLFPLSGNIDHRYSTWMRIKTEHRESLKRSDGLFVVMFMSDSTMLQVAFEMYEIAKIKLHTISSLHHTVRVHTTNLDPFGWFLIVVECRIISLGRARLEAVVFDESRRCVLTVEQEGYFIRELMHKM